jgi:hypothetical protein
LGCLDRVARGPGLIFTEIDGEAVALNAARGACYGVNSVGLRVLQIIEAPTAVVDICDRLRTEFDVSAETCEREIMTLIAELEAEDLVVVERRAG